MNPFPKFDTLAKVLLRAGLAVLPALLLAGCIELDGQRISICYDAAQDELRMLVFNDGLSDNPGRGGPVGTNEFARAVQGGDLVLMDWPLHMARSKFREEIADAGAVPADHELTRLLLEEFHVAVAGHYRDSQGRIGGVQLVTIPHARAFFVKLNKAIDQYVVAHAKTDPATNATPDTTAAAIAMAGVRGYDWITVEGHSLRFSFPVSPSEWTYLKAVVINYLNNEAKESSGDQVRQQTDATDILQWFTATPISYIQGNNQVTLRFGDPATPSTFRFPVRGAYRPNLEAEVARLAPVRIETALAEQLLGAGAKPDPAIAAIGAWGPPEETVRALLSVANSPDAARRPAAIDKLKAWAKQWTADHNLPAAPPARDDEAAWLASWGQWVQRMHDFPVGEFPALRRPPPKPATPAPAK